MSKAEIGIKTHLKSPESIQAKGQAYQAAKRLAKLHKGIKEWVACYHINDLEFTELYSMASEAVQLSISELEYKIDPVMAGREMKNELNKL